MSEDIEGCIHTLSTNLSCVTDNGLSVVDRHVFKHISLGTWEETVLDALGVFVTIFATKTVAIFISPVTGQDCTRLLR